jgi:hypothetical protein
MCAVVSCTVFVYRRETGRLRAHSSSHMRPESLRNNWRGLREHGGPVDCMGREESIRYRRSERGPADQPDIAQRLRNCCWQPAGISPENPRAILRPFDCPLITPFRTPWRSQASPTSWRNPRVTVPCTTRGTPPLIRMTNIARGRRAIHSAHTTSVASPSCRMSFASFRDRHKLLAGIRGMLWCT